ncbi:MAG: PhoH family protein [Candidatus Cloacimonetes bacterium]|nr:PhoH family protein [Candidatus Cloacimonadota bacterium]MCF7814569.1 PhoH family protein [Candidatus Cloacimonadota bacterium]MCF7867765.1 PhoH family protein [Candidatus Cloacimonadota bacterium]MCF7883257.1 PhoH family protein [Candidatus Cloacimonadota bacterium]
MSKKIFVLDTNVLIHNPQALFSFDENHVAIPITVIEEVDNFKKGVDEKGRNARQIGRYLDGLREKGSLKDGVPTEKGGIIQVVLSRKVSATANDILITDTNDNLIIGTALYLKEKNPKSKVVLVSKDANVRIKADAVGLDSANFETDKINFSELYSGYLKLIVDEDTIKEFEDKKFLTNDFGEIYPNQFVILCRNEEDTEGVVARYSVDNNTIYPLKYYTGQEIFGIKARNVEQVMAFDLLMDPEVKLVSLVGKAGTGKTLIALAAGLNQVVEENLYTRLVVSRPVSPLGKDIGYLPGTKEDKFNPWMQPIYDNMEILLSTKNDREDNGNGKIFGKKQPGLKDYLDFGFIELEPLTYIRGRSLPEQYIIIDEAQNLTPHEMKTIITRAGEGTKIVITGDPYQIDIPYLDSESNGLSLSVEKFKQEKITGHITLVKGERSALADLAAKFF